MDSSAFAVAAAVFIFAPVALFFARLCGHELRRQGRKADPMAISPRRLTAQMDEFLARKNREQGPQDSGDIDWEKWAK